MAGAPIGAPAISATQRPLACFYSATLAWNPTAVDMRPAKGRYGLWDYEKLFCADTRSGQDIFDLRGIHREAGCVVVVRPDQYVAEVLPLADVLAISAFFASFMLVPAEIRSAK